MVNLSLIEIFRKIHNDYYGYDFDDTEQVTNNDKIRIICPVHGPFEQLVRNHYKHGCKKCAMEALRLRKFYTTEECIKKFEKKHGTRYDYSAVVYVNEKTPVEITCSTHGKFSQAPKHHWRGWHCPDCGKQIKKIKLRKTTETFIQDARKVWGDRWDYSNSHYIDGLTPITIGCLDHGDFSTPARHHLIGNGCPRCSSGRSDLEELWLDENNIPPSDRHKKIVFSDGTYLFPDGVDEDNKTVYLFMGDYWHGNPAIYPRDKINPTLKKPFGEIYEQTIADIRRYQAAGYHTVVEWESNYTPQNRLYSEVKLDHIRDIIPDTTAAVSFLERTLLRGEPRCPYCGSSHVWDSQKRGLKYCLETKCRKSFNVRVGTIFYKSQIALHKWLYGIYLIKSSKRRMTQKALAVRINLGKEAARVIQEAVDSKKNHAFVTRIFIELNKLPIRVTDRGIPAIEG